MTLNRKAVGRVAIAIFVLLAITFFALALVDAWSATNGELPSLGRLAAAFGCAAFGLLSAAFAWGILLGGRRVDHGAALLVSQLGKYVPGGIWQATGQVGLARSFGVGLKRGATAFTVLAVTQAVAGGAFVLTLALDWSAASPGLRAVLGAAGLASLVLLDRRWMVWALRRIPRTRDTSQELVPSQRSILAAWATNLVTLVMAGTAFLVLLGSLDEVHEPFLVISAYATAWTVGFIAVPIPSGVGIREAVLVAILHGSFPSSVIVAASVYQRLVAVAAEGLLTAVASHRVRPGRIARTTTAEGPTTATRPGTRRRDVGASLATDKDEDVTGPS